METNFVDLSTTDKSKDDLDSRFNEEDAWWEAFLKKHKEDNALDEELRLVWENCEQRRIKFTDEVKQITELYQPIEKLLKSALENDRSRRGDLLYREWGITIFCLGIIIL